MPIKVDLAQLLFGSPGAPDSQLLISGSLLCAPTADWAAGTPAKCPIPCNTAFVCLPWYAQAIVFGDITTDGVVDLDPMFSNAATGIVGGHRP